MVCTGDRAVSAIGSAALEVEALFAFGFAATRAEAPGDRTVVPADLVSPVASTTVDARAFRPNGGGALAAFRAAAAAAAAATAAARAAAAAVGLPA